jgi:hypothetical protein
MLSDIPQLILIQSVITDSKYTRVSTYIRQQMYILSVVTDSWESGIRTAYIHEVRENRQLVLHVNLPAVSYNIKYVQLIQSSCCQIPYMDMQLVMTDKLLSDTADS